MARVPPLCDAEVSPAAFLESASGRWALRIWGFVIEHAVAVAIVFLAGLGWSLRAIVRRIRRRWRARAAAAVQ